MNFSLDMAGLLVKITLQLQIHWKLNVIHDLVGVSKVHLDSNES